MRSFMVVGGSTVSLQADFGPGSGQEKLANRDDSGVVSYKHLDPDQGDRALYLTPTEEEICKKMGLDRVAFLKQRNERLKRETTERERSALHHSADRGAAGLTEVQQQVCRRMNIDPAQFAAHVATSR